MEDPADEFAAIAREIAARAQAAGLRVATAESLTSGAIANALGAAPDASQWFTGGVVAYAESVKRDVLGVTAASITSLECARELATGVASLFDAEAAVSVTGVGGPEPEGDEPAGSVYAAVAVRGDLRDAHFSFSADDPSVVVHQTVRAALELLRDALPELEARGA